MLLYLNDDDLCDVSCKCNMGRVSYSLSNKKINEECCSSGKSRFI